MAYYTRAPAVFGSWANHLRKRPGMAAGIKCREIVAHDDCLPETQFEMVPHSAGAFRHQKQPWCWSRIYGGATCFYCGSHVA